MDYKVYESCIQQCIQTAQQAEFCINECMKDQNTDVLRCIQLNRDCADICLFASQMMMRGSENAALACELCATICEDCAEECNKHSEMQHCIDCAKACEECAAACRKILN
jgi:hypothetical protein